MEDDGVVVVFEAEVVVAVGVGVVDDGVGAVGVDASGHDDADVA